MDIFKVLSLFKLSERFKTDLDCREYFSEIKSNDGFKCVQFGHGAFQVCEDFCRTSNICSHTKSATANTLFHKVKLGVRKAFFICFEIFISTKNLSARYTAVRYEVTQNTARLFMHKLRQAMESRDKYFMDVAVYVGQFNLGVAAEGRIGRRYNVKKKEAVTAVQLTKDAKVNRMSTIHIENFSRHSLWHIFVNNIITSTQITIGKWKGFRPIEKAYSITQVERNKGLNFVFLHTMNHQIMSLIRTLYSWVSGFNLDRYLNEFYFGINRSQSNEKIFNNLITEMVNEKKLYQKISYALNQ
ncbi:MAG: IS1595 family transposase [Flavobacteriaceae bacterium]|nr:IS1595 family transposase [Flavobacteriaceae bacterium]